MFFVFQNILFGFCIVSRSTKKVNNVWTWTYIAGFVWQVSVSRKNENWWEIKKNENSDGSIGDGTGGVGWTFLPYATQLKTDCQMHWDKESLLCILYRSSDDVGSRVWSFGRPDEMRRRGPVATVANIIRICMQSFINWGLYIEQKTDNTMRKKHFEDASFKPFVRVVSSMHMPFDVEREGRSIYDQLCCCNCFQDTAEILENRVLGTCWYSPHLSYNWGASRRSPDNQ
jgi:hypothetical protein